MPRGRGEPGGRCWLTNLKFDRPSDFVISSVIGVGSLDMLPETVRGLRTWSRGLPVSLTAASQSRRREEEGWTLKNKFPLHF
ncbi:hypothetical protein INR49_001798 [Caranx melampygus]|nr:hypothetical protein INR49_001798 [Caranx melampygus]